jgi:predicted transcriptional regulator
MQPLTDAEWQIMRVIWEKQPVAATTIAESLQDVKAWSLTTVKTLLSRLAEKQLVRTDPQGKKFLYRAAWSERDCIVSEMKQVLHRIYGGHLRGWSKRFLFYGADNPALISALTTHLETQTNRIEKRYRIECPRTQEIFLYESKARMHAALGLADAPDWLRAAWVWDILHLAPETAFGDIGIEQALMFVWMQKVLSTVNARAPYWLTQGIASFESGLVEPNRFEETMTRIRPSLHARSVLDLSTHYESFKAQNGYELTRSVVSHIENRYGSDALWAFLQNPEDYLAAFHREETVFWNEWLQDQRPRGRKEAIAP